MKTFPSINEHIFRDKFLKNRCLFPSPINTLLSYHKPDLRVILMNWIICSPSVRQADLLLRKNIVSINSSSRRRRTDRILNRLNAKHSFLPIKNSTVYNIYLTCKSIFLPKLFSIMSFPCFKAQHNMN